MTKDTNISTICGNSTTEHPSTDKYQPYRKSLIAWDSIERANKPKKYTAKTKILGKNAQALFAVINQKLKKQDCVILNHKYISKITLCDRRQNQNIIKQLNNLLKIEYHNSISRNGKKYRYCYSFSLKNYNASKALNSSISDSSIGKKFSRYSIYKENKLNNRSIRSNFNSINLNDLDKLNQNTEELDKIEKADRENDKSVSVANLAVVEKSRRSQLKNTQYKTQSTECVESGKIHAGGGDSTGKDTNSRAEWGISKNKTLKHPPSRKPKTLGDFYPLTEEDCAELQSRSGRPFTKIAMNEILQSLARKAKQVIFWSKKGFLAYMTKVYEHELRDAEKTSSETFKIRSNIDSESIEIAKQEKYLSEIESCLQVSPEWHLKKKLASVLDRSRAYALLTSYKRIELGEGSDAGRCILHMQKQIFLTSNEKEIILNQIRATHELVGEGGEYRQIDTLELKYPERKSNLKSEHSTNNQDQGLWGKIRQIFIKTEGEYGKALDNHWISKLDVTIDEQAKKVELMAPSEFVKSYVEEKLLKSISYSVESLGFSLSGWGA